MFSESAARAIVSLSGADLRRFEELCASHGVQVTRIGEVTGDDQLEFVGQFSICLDEARTAWEAPIPEALA